MANNTYFAYGSQVVLDCENSCNNDSRCYTIKSDSHVDNLKTQFRFFTLNVTPQSSEEDDDLKECNGGQYGNCSNGKETSVSLNEKALVTDNSSCESFYSCESSASEEDFTKTSKDNEEINVKKASAYNNKNENFSDEEFFNQITMVNAIFLSKDSKQQYKQNECSSKYSNQSKNCVFKISCLPVTKKSFNCLDQNTEDGVYKNKCKDLGNTVLKCEHFKNKNNMPKNINFLRYYDKKANLPSRKENERNNKKPMMSKVIHHKKGHRLTLYNYRPTQKSELVCPKPNITESFTLENKLQMCNQVDEIYSGKFLLIKHIISESSEVYFLEPVQRVHYSVFESNENLVTELVDSENITKGEDSVVSNSSDNLSDSLIMLFDESCNIEASGYNLDKGSKPSNEPDTEKNSGCAGDNTTRVSNQILDALSLMNSANFLEFKSPTEVHNVQVTDLLIDAKKLNLLPRSPILYGNVCDSSITDNSYIKNEEHSDNSEDTDQKMIDANENDKLSKMNEIKNLLKNRKTKHLKRILSSCRSKLPSIEEHPEPPSDSSETNISEDNYCLVDTQGRPIHLYDNKGLPLTDGTGRPLRSVNGELLMKCDANGIPVVDEDSQIYDMFGRQPHQEDFQPWLSPENNIKAKRLTMVDGCPMLVFDVEGRPLTSISGTMLVDSSGRTLFTLNSLVQSNI